MRPAIACMSFCRSFIPTCDYQPQFILTICMLHINTIGCLPASGTAMHVDVPPAPMMSPCQRLPDLNHCRPLNSSKSSSSSQEWQLPCARTARAAAQVVPLLPGRPLSFSRLCARRFQQRPLRCISLRRCASSRLHARASRGGSCAGLCGQHPRTLCLRSRSFRRTRTWPLSRTLTCSATR